MKLPVSLVLLSGLTISAAPAFAAKQATPDAFRPNAHGAPVAAMQKSETQATLAKDRFKITRYSIPYRKHRGMRTFSSAPPTLGIDFRRVDPLPESGHNYLKEITTGTGTRP